MTKKRKELSLDPCNHNFNWHYNNSKNTHIIDKDWLGIPAKCSKCNQDSIMWYHYRHICDLDGNQIE